MVEHGYVGVKGESCFCFSVVFFGFWFHRLLHFFRSFTVIICLLVRESQSRLRSGHASPLSHVTIEFGVQLNTLTQSEGGLPNSAYKPANTPSANET